MLKHVTELGEKIRIYHLLKVFLIYVIFVLKMVHSYIYLLIKNNFGLTKIFLIPFYR